MIDHKPALPPYSINFRFRCSSQAMAVETSHRLRTEAMAIGYNIAQNAMSCSTLGSTLEGTDYYGQIKFVFEGTQDFGRSLRSAAEYLLQCGVEIHEVQLASAGGLSGHLFGETVPHP